MTSTVDFRPDSAPAVVSPSRTTLFGDIRTVMVRELKPSLREPVSVIFSMAQPLILLALFGPLLANVPGVPAGAALQWFVPGVLVMIAIFGTSMTGSNLLAEMQGGSHERMLVAPLRRSALLTGRALKEFVPLLAQAVIIVLAVLPFGFRLDVPGALVGLLILGVFGIGLGALSYALAIAVRQTDWMFWVVQQTVLFPILILSGTMLPLDNAPGWIQAVATVNPVGHVVLAQRALFDGDFGSVEVLYGVISAVAVAVVGILVGSRAVRRSVG